MFIRSRTHCALPQQNTAINCTLYGVLITQSYPSDNGTPGSGVMISVGSLVKDKASAD